MKAKMTIVLAAFALTACGQSGLSGTYGTPEKNNVQFVFSGDQVTVAKEGDSVTGMGRWWTPHTVQ